MIPLRTGLFLLGAALLAAFSLQAEQALPAPNWIRADALEAARQADVAQTVGPLFALARSGRDEELLDALRALAADVSRPAPARDWLLQQFTVGLSDLPPFSVGDRVTNYLRAYEPQALVPHADSTAVGIPLFNVPAAAVGLVHDWEAQSAAAGSAELLQAGPDRWLAAYAVAGTAQRRGLATALEYVPSAQVEQLAGRVYALLPADPQLTAVAARCALLLRDTPLMQRTLAAGGGPEIAPALRQATAVFDENERAALLKAAVNEAPAAQGGLAIGVLGPGLLAQPETADLLFDTLGDRDLGAAAALVLSASGDASIRNRLQRLALTGDGLSARRAAIGLQSATRSEGLLP